MNQNFEKSINLDASFNTKGFDNQIFWERRYGANPTLGSGLGSRGKNLELKKDLLRRIIIQNNPKSVLDVGCGDLFPIKDFTLKNYIGIDLSHTIIMRNRLEKPLWNFIKGNFLDLFQQKKLSADLVLCFDVLIHQHNFQEYENFVNFLVRATNKIGLLSAFEYSPDIKFKSKITAFHEPITTTLKKFNASKIRILGDYRNITIISFQKNQKT